MEGFGPATYGDGFADVYDEWYADITDVEATAAYLAGRVVAGPVLELGVGSGRLAGPLAAAGLPVIGIDASSAMLALCRRQQPNVPVVLGDLADLPIGSGIGGAVCAFNTLFNLPTLQRQQRLLASIAGVLRPGAPLVIEAITGSALSAGPGSSVGVSNMAADRLVLSATKLDHEAQTIHGQHVDITASGIVLRPWLLRWTTPPQLDEAAAAVGLTLVERHGGWHGEPFGPESDVHVSMYQRPDRSS